MKISTKIGNILLVTGLFKDYNKNMEIFLRRKSGFLLIFLIKEYVTRRMSSNNRYFTEAKALVTKLHSSLR